MTGSPDKQPWRPNYGWSLKEPVTNGLYLKHCPRALPCSRPTRESVGSRTMALTAQRHSTIKAATLIHSPPSPTSLGLHPHSPPLPYITGTSSSLSSPLLADITGTSSSLSSPPLHHWDFILTLLPSPSADITGPSSPLPSPLLVLISLGLHPHSPPLS